LKKDTKAETAFAAFDQTCIITIRGIDVGVAPLGVKQLRKFSAAITKAAPDLLAAIDASGPKDGAKEGQESGLSDESMSAFMKAIVPFFFSDLLELVDDCCTVSLENIPLEHVPEIVDKWITISFGKPEEGFKGLRPWMDLATRIMDQVASASPTIGQSTGSSQPATSDKT